MPLDHSWKPISFTPAERSILSVLIFAWDTESPNRHSVSREWPIGRAVWLAGSVTPKTLGLPGTWKSYRWSLTTKVGSVLDVKGGSVDVAGAEVQIYSYNNTDAQRWHIYAEGPGVVTLWVRTA